MSKALLAELMEPLPHALREQVEGYVAFVEETADEIFADAHLTPEPVVLGQFLFAAGLRRLWTLVDTQHWMIDRSLVLGEEHGVRGMAIGSEQFTRTGGAFATISHLRANFLREFDRLQIAHLVRAPSLTDLLVLLREERPGSDSR